MTYGESRPEARTDELVIEAVGDELVIFDRDTSVAHALQPLAAAVFRAADGSLTVAEIASSAAGKLGRPVDVSEAYAAVRELQELGLLASGGLRGVSRRRLLQVGGAAAATALVASAVVPAYAAASTTPCAVSTLSQFAVLVESCQEYYFLVYSLAGVNSITETDCTKLSGSCDGTLGGKSNTNCYNNQGSGPTSLSVGGSTYDIQSSNCPNVTVCAGGTSGGVTVNLPSGVTLIAWYLHNGDYCYGPFTNAPSGSNPFIDPCTALS